MVFDPFAAAFVGRSLVALQGSETLGELLHRAVTASALPPAGILGIDLLEEGASPWLTRGSRAPLACWLRCLPRPEEVSGGLLIADVLRLLHDPADGGLHRLAL